MHLINGVLALLILACSTTLFAAVLDGSLQEDGFHLSSTDHAIFSNAKDSNETGSKPTSTLLHENTLRAEKGAYALSIQFTNRYTPDGPKDINKYFLLDKKTLVADYENWEVKTGDSHQELGRGLALSLYRDPAFGVDTTVEGASVRYHPKGFEARAFAGRLNGLGAPVAINPQSSLLEDREILVAAASVTGEVFAGTKVGSHFLYSLARPLDGTRYNKQWQAFGATLAGDSIVEGVDGYVESNVLLTRALGDRPQELPQGFATYGSLSWSASPWKLKFEAKDYRHYYFDFRRPPTLEDDIVVSLNTQDVSAGKLYAEHRFVQADTTAFASYLGGEDRNLKATLQHGLLGAKFPGFFETKLEVKGGYRLIGDQSDMIHASIKGKLKTGRGEYLEIGFRKVYTRSNLNFLPTEEDRNMYDLTYTFSEQISASLGYEFLPTRTNEAGKHFANVGGAYRLGSFTGKAFVGQTSGGTLCSGGVCRQVPPYTGAMVETTYVF